MALEHSLCERCGRLKDKRRCPRCGKRQLHTAAMPLSLTSKFVCLSCDYHGDGLPLNVSGKPKGESIG